MLQISPGNRRHFFTQLSTGLGSLALGSLLGQERARAEAGPGVIKFDPTQPELPRMPNFAPRAKSVIFLHMVGGPSPLDTFDYKPLLQQLDGQPVPASFRKSVEKTRFHNVFVDCRDLMASPFRFSQHGQSGMWISELFPNLARQVDDLCFIHSMQADSNNHAPSCYQMHTGATTVGKASLGSWITYGLGSANQDLPAYVLLFEAGPYGGAGNYTNAFLPAAFQGTRLRSQGPPVLDILPPQQFASGQRASLDLLHKLNLKHRSARPEFSELDARIASYELAYRMQTAAFEVGDLESEPTHVRELYGLGHQDQNLVKFGRKCLLARRLVERGVRFVQIYNMFNSDGWDAHTGLPDNHVRLARQCDQPVAALLSDLKQHGLLDETLVVWGSEFGRTPMMQNDHGRQHNSAGFTLWMAGGGVRPGRIGSTDELGLLALDRPHTFADLHATILAALGLDNRTLTFPHAGLNERLTGVTDAAQVIPGSLI